jgi:hypothetical protein
LNARLARSGYAAKPKWWKDPRIGLALECKLELIDAAFRVEQVADEATGTVRVRVTGVAIPHGRVILLEPDGLGGYRVEVKKSSGSMTAYEHETVMDYVRAALAEFAP